MTVVYPCDNAGPKLAIARRLRLAARVGLGRALAWRRPAITRVYLANKLLAGQSICQPRPAWPVDGPRTAAAWPRLAASRVYLACSLALSLAFLPLTAYATTPPEVTARRLLSDKDFPFCQPDGKLEPADAAWCELAADATAACPALPALCERLASGGTGREAEVTVKEPDLDRLADRSPRLKLDMRAMQYAMLGILAAALAWFALQVLARRSSARSEQAARPLPPATLVQPKPETPRPLGEVERLLAEADSLMERDPGRALACLYAATLRRLQEQGLVHWQAATSNREYLRTVRGKTPLEPILREVVDEVERHRFGHATPQADRVRHLARTLTHQLRGLTITLLALGLTACGGGDSTMSGKAGVWQLLRENGVEVSSFALPLGEVTADSPPLLVDGDQLPLDRPVRAELRRAVRQGARVLVLAGTLQSLEPMIPAGVTEVSAEPLLRTGSLANDTSQAQGRLPGRKGLAIWQEVHGLWGEAHEQLSHAADLLQEAAHPDDQPALDETAAETAQPMEHRPELEPSAEPPPDPAQEPPHEPSPAPEDQPYQALDRKVYTGVPEVLVRRGDAPFAALWQIGRGRLLVVADDRLFANGALALPGHPSLVVDLVRALLSDTWDQPGGRRLAVAQLGVVEPSTSPKESLERAGLWPLMLQALLAMGLLLLARGRAFGRLRDRDESRRRAFREHVEALGLQLERRQASRKAAALYAGWALDRLWQRAGPRGERRDVTSLSQSLARQLRRDPEPILQTLHYAEALRADPHGPDHPAADLQVVGQLGEMLAGLESPPPASATAPAREPS